MSRRFFALWVFVTLLFPPLVLAQASGEKWSSLPMTLDLASAQGRYIPLQNGRPMISFEPQDRPMLDLAGTWRKLRLNVDHTLSMSPRTADWLASVELETGGATRENFDDSTWAEHQLPGVENEMPATPDNPLGAEVYDQGIYYRRHIDIPGAWDGRVVRLVALACDYVADVWVNGEWVGYHEGGYTPFAFDISEYLHYGEDNVIVFRVDAMPWTLRMDILPNLFATDWMHYAGVVQDVYLTAAPPAHIVRADVLPQNTYGDLDVSIVTENRGVQQEDLSIKVSVHAMDREHPDYLSDPITAHLLGAPATLSGSTSKNVIIAADGYLQTTFHTILSNPALWTPADPNLYVLTVDLVRDGSVIDSFATQFGVRTVEVGEGAKIMLNNRPTFFTGMARHEDWPDSGRTATMAKIAEDLQIIRDTNVWFLRTAHYPNHPNTYLLTDRMGFAVWSEIPAWWINYFSIPVLLERGLAQQMWREMIWNGRNRPSILFWSLCNEPMWYLVFNLRSYVQTLHEDLDDNYPDGRLVTESLAADGALLTGSSVNDVDVIGWTMYFGVFYGEDIAAETTRFLLDQHERHPNKPIIACEFGYWSNSDDSETARQVEVAEETLDAFLPLAAVDADGDNTDGFLAGVTWWCQFNWYRVDSAHIQSMGIMHMDRETDKPVRQTLIDRYRPYFEMGGLGEPVDTDDDDDTADDDAADDDNDNDDDDDAEDADDDNAGDEGCGC